MQSAEKVTPTFIAKLVVLFALLLVGVFMRTGKISARAEAKEANRYFRPANAAEPEVQQEGNPVYKLVKQENQNDSSI